MSHVCVFFLPTLQQTQDSRSLVLRDPRVLLGRRLRKSPTGELDGFAFVEDGSNGVAFLKTGI